MVYTVYSKVSELFPVNDRLVFVSSALSYFFICFFHIFGLSFQIAVDQGPVIRRPIIVNVVNVGFNFIPSSCFVSLKLS